MMAGFFLQQRQAELVEWMDRDDCDPELLRNTYRFFPVINRFISRWKSVYNQFIRPQLQPHRNYRLLDVGSGGGDITRNIWRWAKNDGFKLEVTGIDPDPRALEFAQAIPVPDSGSAGLHFLKTDTSELIKSGIRYDFVICNHVLHHLPVEKTSSFLNDLANLAEIRVICSDIERSTAGFILFSVATLPLFPKSYIRKDGLISIRKSFRQRELQTIMPAGWTVIRQFPFRLLAVRDMESDPLHPQPARGTESDPLPPQAARGTGSHPHTPKR